MASEVDNVLRTLTTLEKALDRLGRLNYLERKQYPQIFLAVEESLNEVKVWITENRLFSSLKMMYQPLIVFIKTLSDFICQLWDTFKPKNGKKHIDRTRKSKERQSIFKSINSTLAISKKSLRIEIMAWKTISCN